MSSEHLKLQVREPEKQRRRQQSNEPEFIEDVTHEYDKLVYVGARAQKNCSSEQRKLTKDDRNGNGDMSEQRDCTDGNRTKSLPRTFIILNCLGFLLSIPALLLAILLIAGTLPILNCGSCNKMEPFPKGKEEEASTISPLMQERLWNVIRQLKSNLSRIEKSLKERDAKILRLQVQGLKRDGKIAELERKFTYRVYVFNGTAINVTDADIDLTTGKLRDENLTTCNYRREEGTQFTADESTSGNVIVTEKKGYKILGVACSTIGASEYNLNSQISRASLRQYECECTGRSSTFKSGNAGLAKCIIHYWICKM
ncbi:uncharacterized protein LOC114956732 [Acropora millepora]|uniref:uncharacterized protein LOC114956732 n=1 Tax=Acropora millepora TaxID=45264 RepID=UPI001CF10BEF|nr:uncharacterized protein LOC114956732 [Acropora millepora]